MGNFTETDVLAMASQTGKSVRNSFLGIHFLFIEFLTRDGIMQWCAMLKIYSMTAIAALVACAEMTTVSCMHQDDASHSVSIELCDMARAPSAFGICSHYRRLDMDFADTGQGAVVSELSVQFWQGCYFGRLNAGSLSPFMQGAMRILADRIAAALLAEPRALELSFLPAEDQTPHSLRDVTSSYQGIASFQRAIIRRKRKQLSF